MTCTEARALLPAHVYGDLATDQAAALAAHLRGCVHCRAEAAALGGVRTALDAMPVPGVRVDVPALFATLAERRVRRWRRIAIAGAALAAGLLVVLGSRLNVTVAAGQVVIAWGAPVSREAEPVAAAETAGLASRLNDLEERLQLQQELTSALAADIQSRDRDRAGDIANVRLRLDAVQQSLAHMWADTEKTMNALYVAQFKRPEEKSNP